MMNWLKRFLQDFPTTPGRIVFTLFIVLCTAVRYLVFGVPYRMAGATGTIPVVDGWGYWLLFLAAMAGLDVGQYIGKRFSDTGYATAKSAASPSAVNVESARTVTAESATVVAAPRAMPAMPVASVRRESERGGE